MQELAGMIGKTLTDVDGAHAGSEEIRFSFDDGSSARFFHGLDCCEKVRVEDVAGDPKDLIGVPLLMAEEVSSEGATPPGPWIESFTWTFYKFATAKGYVTVRWLGVSNGFYSESVDVEITDRRVDTSAA